MITNALLASLRQIVSSAYVVDDEDTCLLYGSDASGQQAPPGAVVLPGSEQEAAKILDVLSQTGHPVTLRGSGSAIVGGSVPEKEGIVVSLARITEPIALAPDDPAIRAPAGARMVEVTRKAEAKGFRFRHPLSTSRVGTVGGFVARNSDGLAGASGFAHGMLRGIRALTSRGDLIATGAGLHGINCHVGALLPGSEGSLALVTEATFALVPTPAEERIVVARFDDLVAAVNAGAGLLKAGAVPLAADAVDATTWSHVAEWPVDGKGDALLLVWLAGCCEALDDESIWVRDICRDHLARATREVANEELRAVVPGWREAIRTGKPARHQLPLDAAVPPALLPEFVRHVVEQSRTAGIQPLGVVRVPEGVISMKLPVVPTEVEPFRRGGDLARKVMRRATDLDGTPFALYGIGKLRRDGLGSLFSETDLHAMREVKGTYDGDGALAVTLSPTKSGDRRDPLSRAQFEGQIMQVQEDISAQIEEVIAAQEPTRTHPETPLMLSQVLRMARVHRTPVSVDDQASTELLDIGLEDLSEILVFEPDSRVLVAEGGVTLSKLHDLVLPAGLWVPFHPFTPQDTALATVLAWDQSNFTRPSSGATKEWVTGLEAVTGLGERLSWGGMAPTQNVGLRMSELCLGARHRYAVITSAALRLTPLPAVWAAMRARFAGQGDPLERAAAFLRSVEREGACAPPREWIVWVPKSETALAILVFEGTSSRIEADVAYAREKAEAAARRGDRTRSE